MTREAHFINPTVGKERPTSALFFDCETSFSTDNNGRQTHRAKLAVAQHWRHFSKGGWRLQKECVAHDTKALSDFINRCTRKKSVLYLFAHNVQFDLLVSSLFLELRAADWELDSFYFKGLVSIFEWRHGSQKIVALDTANFFQGRLAELGEMLGFPKLEIDFKTATAAQLLAYCRRDVEILVKLFRGWLDFLDEHDLGSFKRTLASTSFNAWRHRFLKHKLYVHNESAVLTLEDSAYHGGRVEVFRRGVFDDDTYYRLDVNAMYPSIMASEKFPVSLYAWKYDLSVDKLASKLEKYAVIADVDLETEEAAFPQKTADALIYPVGCFRTTLCTPELRLLMDCGIIHKVHFAAWYQQQPIFAEYMNYLYELRMNYRKQEYKPYEKMAKVMANSAYGKWGQRTIITELLSRGDGRQADVEYLWDMDNRQPYKRVHLAGDIFTQKQGGYSYHAFPAIAAHVTAYGRMGIYQYIRQAGRENVYHVDTDGLIVNQAGFERLQAAIDSDRLGMLKIEEVCNWLEVKAPKHYYTPTTAKIKGIRQDATEITFDLYSQQHFAGLNTMAVRGDLSAVHVDRVVKLLTFPVRSGVLQKDGRILPFRLR